MNKLRGTFRIRTFGRRAYLAAWLFGCTSLRVDFAAARQPYTTWRDYLGGPSFSHYSAPQQIDRSNVNSLRSRGCTLPVATAADPNEGTLYVLSMDLPAILKLVKKAPRIYGTFKWRVLPCNEAALFTKSPFDAPAHFAADTIKTAVNQGFADMPAFPEISDSLLNALLVSVIRSAPAPVRDPGSDAAPKRYPNGAERSAPVRYWIGYGMEPTIIGPPWSTLTAFDLNEGTIKWQVPLGVAPLLASQGIKNTGVMMPGNGPVVTAGGLILVATKSEGKLHVYDKGTGKEIRTADLPAASEGVPAVYEVSGREYIALCATTAKSSAIPRDGAPELSKGPMNRSYVAFALPNSSAAKQ